MHFSLQQPKWLADITPEQFGARGGGADDTDALMAMAAAVNALSSPASVVINGIHRTTKTIITWVANDGYAP